MQLSPCAEPALQRTRGTGRLIAGRRGEATAIRTLFQEGAAKIRLPRHPVHHGMEAVAINTAGGVTGGDRLDWRFEAGAGARLTVTTQACEKIYRADTEVARIATTLAAGHGATLAWLPQETILFDGAALTRSLDAELSGDARLIAVEALLFGRAARGETVRRALFRDRWRVRVDGRLVHADDRLVDGDAAAPLGHAATGGGNAAFATLLLVHDDAPDRVTDARDLLAGYPSVICGVSGWRAGPTGKLLARLVARDGYELRRALVPLIGLLNLQAPMPRIWST